MSIKVAVLQSGEQIIAGMKEIVSEDKPIASESKDKSSVEVTLAKWILISDEDDIPVSVNQVVTLVEPVESVKKMYEEKVNGSDY